MSLTENEWTRLVHCFGRIVERSPESRDDLVYVLDMLERADSKDTTSA